MHRVARRFGQSLLLQLGFMVAAGLPVQAAEARPKVVVVVDPQADGMVARQAQAVGAALHDKVALVPLTDYLRAAKALGARPKATYGSEMAVSAGRAVAATHVLLFEPVVVRNGRRRTSTLVAMTLVDTANGESVVERRSGKESARAAAETAQKLAAQVLATASAAPSAYAAATPVPQPVAAAVPPAVATPPLVAPPLVAPVPAAVAPKATGKAAKPSKTDAAAEDLQLPPAPAPAEAPAPAPVAQALPEVAPVARKREAPYGVHVQVGGMIYQRIALVREGNTPELRYGGSNGKKAPLFSRVSLRFELQPTRFGGTHPVRWWDSVLLFGDADLGWARSATPRGAVSRPNGSWQLGGGWRQPLWHSPLASVLTLKLGYSRYSFAVPPGARFVSDGFTGLLAEAALEAPLGLRQIAFVGQAGLLAGLKGFGGTRQLGTAMKSALGGRAEFGLRFMLFGHLDLDITGSWQRYRATFTGPTRVGEFPRSYNNAGLSDQSLGAQARIGGRW